MCTLLYFMHGGRLKFGAQETSADHQYCSKGFCMVVRIDFLENEMLLKGSPLK
jgi:hypothetical protein